MASPTVQVKDGAAAYVATTGGVNVTPGNTVIIKLASSADVDTWSITCLTTDELTTPATINGALVIDSVARTATFTAPVAGRALRFQSQVNSGRDRNNLKAASYTTTFGVYTATAAGNRVHALDETTEGNALVGWGADVNVLIRTPAGSGSTPTGTGVRKVVAGVENAAASTIVDADVSGSAAITLTKVTAPTGSGIVRVNTGAWVSSGSTVSLTADVTGVLPTANQAAQPMGGDVGGTTAASTISGLALTKVTAPTATGVVKVAAGAWVSAAASIVDADVSATAAIAGSKISPNFGSQNVVTTGNHSAGTTPATTGFYQMANGGGIRQRNAANTNDTYVTQIDAATNALYIGSDTSLTAGNQTSYTRICANASVYVMVAAATHGIFDGTGLQLYATGTYLAVGTAAADGASAGAIRMRNGANGLVKWRNAANSADINGISVDASNYVVVGDATDLATLIKGANAGFFSSAPTMGGAAGAIFIANATTAPSTNPTGGGILYVSAGALMYRGSSGTITTIAPA